MARPKRAFSYLASALQQTLVAVVARQTRAGGAVRAFGAHDATGAVRRELTRVGTHNVAASAAPTRTARALAAGVVGTRRRKARRARQRAAVVLHHCAAPRRRKRPVQ